MSKKGRTKTVMLGNKQRWGVDYGIVWRTGEVCETLRKSCSPMACSGVWASAGREESVI